jgi:trehalose 6-phosphate phosphatase
VVDFDGTLAPIVDHPEDAVARPESLEAVRALVDRLALVAIVSGRPIAFLRERVGIDGVVLVGQYGMEHLVDDHIVFDPDAEPYVGPVAAVAAEAASRWPRLVIERKGSIAVALHWRTVPDAAPPVDDVGELAARHGLALLPGRMVVELRPPLAVDKGTAVESLLSRAGISRAAFAGDDVGDLAAFDALDRLTELGVLETAVRVAVVSEETPAELLRRADATVDGPPGLGAALEELEGSSGPG